MGRFLRHDSKGLYELMRRLCPGFFHGASPNKSTPTGQYTVALEPTTSPNDSLEIAITGTMSLLESGTRLKSELSFTIIDFEDVDAFRQVLNATLLRSVEDNRPTQPVDDVLTPQCIAAPTVKHSGQQLTFVAVGRK
jgi:hypothetical protein